MAREEDARDARHDALESENHALRSEVARLRQQLVSADDENRRLRGQLDRLQGNHEVLPVVIPPPTPTVDLSRLDTTLVLHIASFVGTTLELLNLALTCKSFGWQQLATGQDWSLVEEVARQVVCSGKNDVEGARINLSPYVRGTTTWLSILRESEHPLKFDTLLGRGIEYANERRTFIHTSSGVSTAVASNYVMISGIHYAEFQIDTGTPCIGVVRPMPNLDPARFANDNFYFFKRSSFDDFIAARTDEWGAGNVHYCEYVTVSGRMSWTNWDGERQYGIAWEGGEVVGAGDTVGLLLNLNEGTLTVYKNNRRLGVMKDGLSGSYCWCATIVRDGVLDAITIKRCDPPTA